MFLGDRVNSRIFLQVVTFLRTLSRATAAFPGDN